MKPKRSLRVLLTLLALAVTTAPAVESSAFARDNKQTRKNTEAKKGIAKKKARQAATGSTTYDENGKPVRTGNHDKLTKPNKKGPKGDKHAKGVAQHGSAGNKKDGN